jgi:hypothetical protein
MPRGRSAQALNYTGPMLWLADITTCSGAQYYFAEDQLSFAGQSYLPYLRLMAGPRFSRSLRTDAAEVELLNSDLTVARLLEVEPSGFEGAACALQQLLLGIDEAVLIFRGRLTEQEQTDTGVRFRLISELDPAQLDLPDRRYAQLCTWRFSQPGRLSPCGYNPVGIGDVAENVHGERTADIFSSDTIGDSTLTEAPDSSHDRVAVITAGTGRGQKRRIRTNTATTFTLYHPWATVPDGTSKFRVFPLSKGAPKLLLKPTTGVLQSAVTSATARSLTDSTLDMQTDEHAGDLLAVVSGTASGQRRRIGSNTATTLTLADSEPDFAPVPAVNDQFRILYRTCPKDFAPSCEDRARTHTFNGFPTLVPVLRRFFGGRYWPGGLPSGSAGTGRGHIDPMLY